MIKQIFSALCFGLVAALVAPVQADITISASATPSTIQAGSMGILSFTGTTTTTSEAADVMTGFTVAFTPADFGGANLADLSWSDPTSGFGFTGLEVIGNDIYLRAGGSGSQTLGTSFNLGTIKYTIAGGATEAGGFNLPFLGAELDLTGGSTTVNTGGSSTLVFGAVPEPTSLGFLVGAAGLVVLRRRRRKA